MDGTTVGIGVREPERQIPVPEVPSIGLPPVQAYYPVGPMKPKAASNAFERAVLLAVCAGVVGLLVMPILFEDQASLVPNEGQIHVVVQNDNYWEYLYSIYVDGDIRVCIEYIGMRSSDEWTITVSWWGADSTRSFLVDFTYCDYYGSFGHRSSLASVEAGKVADLTFVLPR